MSGAMIPAESGEPGVICGAEKAYGPYAEGMREAEASCADYLGRITRQLDGVPSRHYVAEKAHALREAAGRLIALCHDVEGWLRFCGRLELRPPSQRRSPPPMPGSRPGTQTASEVVPPDDPLEQQAERNRPRTGTRWRPI